MVVMTSPAALEGVGMKEVTPDHNLMSQIVVEHALCSGGWKAGCRRCCFTKLASFSPGCGQHQGQAALVPDELPPAAGLAA